MATQKYLFKEIQVLEQKVDRSRLPAELNTRIMQMLARINRMARLGSYSSEYEIISKYVDWVVSVPWGTYTEDNLDVENARKVLDKNHYGLGYTKERVLEYLSVRNLLVKKKWEHLERAPVICFVGLQGTGKTTMASSVAEALGRKFIRVSLGALGSALELRGRNRASPGAEPGQIVKSLIRTKVQNPLILLDEMDKVSGERGLRSDIMAVLLEILDPEQNSTFRDHYIDFPIDLSKVMFVASANNIGSFSAALLDRLEIITMPSYTDEEKRKIAKDFLLPKIQMENGLDKGDLIVNDDVWDLLIRPLGYDSGIRSLKRILDSIARKTARILVSGKQDKVVITAQNLKQFLPER